MEGLLSTGPTLSSFTCINTKQQCVSITLKVAQYVYLHYIWLVENEYCCIWSTLFPLTLVSTREIWCFACGFSPLQKLYFSSEVQALASNWMLAPAPVHWPDLAQSTYIASEPGRTNGAWAPTATATSCTIKATRVDRWAVHLTGKTWISRLSWLL